MRVYVTEAQLAFCRKLLREKDVAYHVFREAFELVKVASDQATWGCALFPISGLSDVTDLLEAWNRDSHDQLLVEAAIIPRFPEFEYLLACPPWALQDPYVRTLIRKLSGTKPPSSLVNWEKCDGLVPVIAQDAMTKQVLMQAFMDEIAWEETLRTGRAVYFSRSRRKLWRKGEESGNVQIVKEIRIDCDADSVVLMVEQVGGAACHTGYASCFYQKVEVDGGITIVGEPVFDPAAVYGN